jgi:ATP-binding cassette subfamily B protein
VPACVNFLGTLIVFATVDWRAMIVFGVFVVLVTGSLIISGERGRSCLRSGAWYANTAGGEPIDAMVDMWAVKAFPARQRELAQHRSALKGS